MNEKYQHEEQIMMWLFLQLNSGLNFKLLET